MKKLIFLAILAVGLVAFVAPQQAHAEDEKFTVHGEVRVRGEYQNNAADFNDNVVGDSAGFWPYRVRLAVEGHFSKNVSAYIEMQNADTFGGSSPFRNGFGGNDGVELYQGNITFDKLWSDSFNLVIGRQEIVLGNELMMGDLDFYNGISHDGGVGGWDFDGVDVTVWYARQTEGSLPSGNAGMTPDNTNLVPSTTGRDHFGGYATWSFKNDRVLDVYMINVNPSQLGDYQTFGGRFAHDSMDTGFIWNIEYAKQFGDFPAVGLQDADGTVLEAWFGYNWKRGSNVHRLYGQYKAATGDDASTGGDNEGYIPLFDDVHNRLGRGDWFRLAADSTNLGAGAGGVIGGGGIVATSIGYNGFYNDRHEFGVAFWSYELEEDNGAAFDDLGDAIDLWYGFNYSRNVNFVVSYSQLDPGDALTMAPADDEVSRLYGQVRLRF